MLALDVTREFFQKAKAWEILWLAAFPVLVLLVVLGQIYGLPKLLLGYVFLLIPFDFGFGLIIVDLIRHR
jgi:hypothetical protein